MSALGGGLTDRRNTLPLYLARWNGMHMAACTDGFTPKPKAEPWERWKSGQWVADVTQRSRNESGV